VFGARSSGAYLQLFSVALGVLLFSGNANSAEPKSVLVLYASTRLLPAAVEVDRALREGIATSADKPVEVYAEFLDLPRFGSPAFIQTFATYLHEKYEELPPDVILAVGSDSLVLVVRNRAQLFPDAPVVYITSTKALVEPLEPLPRDVIGIPVVYDSAGTVAQALRFHPRARRLVVVTGASDQDREQADRLHDELAPFADRVAIEYISGLPTKELEKRLAEVGPDSVVFTPGYFQDGDKHVFAPREAAERIAAAAARAPVYGPYSTFIGTGVVGGQVPSFEGMGRQGAEIVNQVLAGVPLESLLLPDKAPTHFELDWRQATRWGIAEADIPAGAVIRFKEPTFWEAYRDIAIAAIAVTLVQAALITGLLLERRTRRQTAVALDESEQRMGLAARAAGLSTWSWEVGRAEPAGLGMPHPIDRPDLERAAREALDRDEDLSVEYRVLRPDGEIRWFTAYGRAEKDGSRRLMGVSRDVTERKVAEHGAEQDRAALRHVMRVSTLGQLSASIAHQLNQPLAAILSNAEAAGLLLARDPLDLGELREICDDIVRSDNRAVEVIRRLTALFRRGEVPLEPVDVNELLTETLELTRSELLMRHIVLVTELAPDLPAVQGGRVQLQQVFLNLIVNAMDAMADTKEKERELSVRTAAVGPDVRVFVSDAGSGILTRDLEKVFDPFWTTKPSGMGMGLAICRSVVDSHHGTLSAANNPDRGATFCVTLPVAAA
jgi:C4-dicarboxylate-specific signal transduction histidine kinase